MWHFESWFSGGLRSTGLTVGLKAFKSLFQPKCFCDSWAWSSTWPHSTSLQGTICLFSGSGLRPYFPGAVHTGVMRGPWLEQGHKWEHGKGITIHLNGRWLLRVSYARDHIQEHTEALDTTEHTLSMNLNHCYGKGIWDADSFALTQ